MKTKTGYFMNWVVMLSMVFGMVASPALAAIPQGNLEQTSQAQPGSGPVVSEPVSPADNSGLPPAPPADPTVKGDPVESISGRQLGKGYESTELSSIDQLVQSEHGAINMPAPLTNWEGISQIGVGAGVYPPDTDGDVGPNHYVQIVNHGTTGSWVRIWDKTGTQLYDFGLNPLWPVADPCNSFGNGDPIALYDQLADRWLLSQFAFSNTNGPFYECIAISKTGTPTNVPSDWWAYSFQVSTTKLNDYPKLGVWPDAYYMTANLFNAGSLSWAGTGMWALDRAAMLAGSAATFQYFEFGPSDWGGMLPADLDGMSLPPAGTPGYFMEVHADEWDPAFTQDEVAIYEFDVDWAVPGNSTFTQVALLPMAAFDGDMCGFARSCIPQPGTAQGLDAIADRAMFRLAYRNPGGYETMVSNITVDSNGADRAGIRWFELRKSGGVWSVHQEGTYSPDSDNRWMGSIAMDHVGNIGLGYSVSSSTVFPSIRYAGRLAGDPLGTLPQAETSIIAGSGSQTGTASRWGDYSAMAVDPVDDCTFWYTTEYIQTTGAIPWQTRVASFKFPNCVTGPSGTLNGSVTDANTLAPINGANVFADGGYDYSATTNTSGAYTLTVAEDTYTVTASVFGYLPDTVTGVTVVSGTITTQDFALTPAAMALVSGKVTDANTGWPLYAEITITGVPGSVWTDPVTGYYTVNLAHRRNLRFPCRCLGGRLQRCQRVRRSIGRQYHTGFCSERRPGGL